MFLLPAFSGLWEFGEPRALVHPELPFVLWAPLEPLALLELKALWRLHVPQGLPPSSGFQALWGLQAALDLWVGFELWALRQPRAL